MVLSDQYSKRILRDNEEVLDLFGILWWTGHLRSKYCEIKNMIPIRVKRFYDFFMNNSFITANVNISFSF